MASSLQWTSDTLTKAFGDAPRIAKQYLARTTAYYSLRAETYAKSKARWTDRTGNARSGLSSEFHVDSNLYQIDIYHRVSYGIWLEVRWNSKYGIISRTVGAEGPRFFKAANDIMAKMFGGS